MPIILNVIDNSKKGAAKDSAYGYKDAINKYYVSELYDNQNLKLNGTYTITDKGELSDGTNVYEISFSGNIPSAGNLTYENNVLKNGCITIDEYKVNIEDGEVTTVKKGSCTSSEVSNFGGQVITEIPENGHTGVKAIVYLDPTDITAECNVELANANKNQDDSKSGIKSGCMKWYAYKDEDGYYTMILDHNITNDVIWITQADYEQTGSQISTPSSVGIEYDGEKVNLNDNGLPEGSWSSNGTNNRGPITLLNQLKTDTIDWDESLKLAESDKYTVEWANANDYYNGNQKYTINYNGYKARLISAEEINEITNSEYFDDNCLGSGSCNAGENAYAWLFDYTGFTYGNCTQYGCNEGTNFDAFYWTMTPNNNFHYGSMIVFYEGKLLNNTVSSGYCLGLRPVIKVSKAKLK